MAVSDGTSRSVVIFVCHCDSFAAGAPLNVPAMIGWWQCTQCLGSAAGSSPVPSWHRLHSSLVTSSLPRAASPSGPSGGGSDAEGLDTLAKAATPVAVAAGVALGAGAGADGVSQERLASAKS